jgi:hypothetical protein
MTVSMRFDVDGEKSSSSADEIHCSQVFSSLSRDSASTEPALTATMWRSVSMPCYMNRNFPEF